MKRVAVLLFLGTLVACASAPPGPGVRTRLDITVTFAPTPSGACRGSISPKRKHDGARVQVNGTVVWTQAGSCGEGSLTWEVENFEHDRYFFCSGNANDKFPPETSGNTRVRKAVQPGMYCYEIVATWNGQKIRVDPEIDVMN